MQPGGSGERDVHAPPTQRRRAGTSAPQPRIAASSMAANPIVFCAGRGGARRAGLARHRGGDGRRHVAVEDRGDDVVLAQLVVADDRRDRRGGGHLHRLGDLRGARTSSAPRKMPGKQRTLLIWFG